MFYRRVSDALNDSTLSAEWSGSIEQLLQMVSRLPMDDRSELLHALNTILGSDGEGQASDGRDQRYAVA
jgi:hypothetical protein